MRYYLCLWGMKNCEFTEKNIQCICNLQAKVFENKIKQKQNKTQTSLGNKIFQKIIIFNYSQVHFFWDSLCPACPLQVDLISLKLYDQCLHNNTGILIFNRDCTDLKKKIVSGLTTCLYCLQFLTNTLNMHVRKYLIIFDSTHQNGSVDSEVNNWLFSFT